MGQLHMNYEEMRSVAGDVQGQAERSREVIAALQADVDRIEPTWVGESARAFVAVYGVCRKALQRVPLILDQVSRALHDTADMIEQAEQQAQASIHAVVTADDA